MVESQYSFVTIASMRGVCAEYYKITSVLPQADKLSTDKNVYGVPHICWIVFISILPGSVSNYAASVITLRQLLLIVYVDVDTIHTQKQ